MTIDERLRYIGALAVLAECAVHVPDELRDEIDAALDDGARHLNLRVRRIVNRRELEPE